MYDSVVECISYIEKVYIGLKHICVMRKINSLKFFCRKLYSHQGLYEFT